MNLYVVSRSNGAPAVTVPPDEVGIRVFTQLWQTRQQPYDSLADGDTLFWADQKTREIRWELRVRNVRRSRCRDMNEYAGYLRNWFGVLDPETGYGAGRSDRWLLAWENELVRPLGMSLPEGFKLGRNGFRLIDLDEHNSLGLPPPGEPALLPVATVVGPVQVFGPGARRTIPAQVRAAVFARDGHECRSCSSTEGPFHLDHIFPFSKGGPSTVENLQVLCARCNLAKGAQTDGSIAELLLPDSALPRLLVAAGKPRPDTVGAAGDTLVEVLTSGDVSVEEAALAVLESLAGLNWDDECCAQLAAAFGAVGLPDADAWFRLIDCLAVTHDNMEMINGLWDEFETLLADPGVVGDVAAAVVAPSRVLALLSAVENGDESAPDIGNLNLRAPDGADLVSRAFACPDEATARRARPLEFLDLDSRVRNQVAQYEDINPLFERLIAERSAIDPLAYFVAVLVLKGWYDTSGDQGLLDAAISSAVAATASIDTGFAINACTWVTELALERNAEGDAELAEFYTQVANRIKEAGQSDHDSGSVER